MFLIFIQISSFRLAFFGSAFLHFIFYLQIKMVQIRYSQKQSLIVLLKRCCPAQICKTFSKTSAIMDKIFEANSSYFLLLVVTGNCSQTSKSLRTLWPWMCGKWSLIKFEACSITPLSRYLTAVSVYPNLIDNQTLRSPLPIKTKSNDNRKVPTKEVKFESLHYTDSAPV